MHDSRTIVVYEGNARDITFRLRKKGQRDFFDVSTASKIQLELDSPKGVERTPIEADESHPNADWANGKVIVSVDNTNLSDVVGTHPYALTVFIGAEEITVVTGNVEVAERPGFPAPAP
jgi:hypothetical protein